MEKKIWIGEEIPIAHKLLKYREGLINDFMKGFDNLEDAIMANTINSIQPQYLNVSLEEAKKFLVQQDPITRKWNPTFDVWRSTLLRNKVELNGKVELDEYASEEDAKKFPTAMALLDEFSDACYGLVYSGLGPRSILQRHVGPENIDGLYLRVHLPLIIPKGDVFLEVDNEEVTWDQLMGFNNQYLHSAHNYTNEWRLVMIMDLRRELIGMEPGKYNDQSDRIGVDPFVRGYQN